MLVDKGYVSEAVHLPKRSSTFEGRLLDRQQVKSIDKAATRNLQELDVCLNGLRPGQENMRTLQGDAAFLQVSMSHQQEVGARLETYIAESEARLQAAKARKEVQSGHSRTFGTPTSCTHGSWTV